MKKTKQRKFHDTLAGLPAKERKRIFRYAGVWRDSDVRQAKGRHVPKIEKYVDRILAGETQPEPKKTTTNKTVEKDVFRCTNCNELIARGGAGSEHRNHCPWCLHSLHLDDIPGDRAANCGGLMEPVAVWVRTDGEWAVIHRCCECGDLSSNRIAADDNPALLISLAAKPLASPPFPLDRLR